VLGCIYTETKTKNKFDIKKVFHPHGIGSRNVSVHMRPLDPLETLKKTPRAWLTGCLWLPFCLFSVAVVTDHATAVSSRGGERRGYGFIVIRKLSYRTYTWSRLAPQSVSSADLPTLGPVTV